MPGRALCKPAIAFAAAIVAAGAVPAKAVMLPKAAVEPIEYSALTGWEDDDHAAAYAAFLKSCGAIRHGTPKMRKAKPIYGGLYTACMKALSLGNRSPGRNVPSVNSRRRSELILDASEVSRAKPTLTLLSSISASLQQACQACYTFP